MRIVIVAESFLPQINGVANTVRHVADRLAERGDEVQIIAAGPGPDSYHSIPVVRARSFGFPGYKEFPVGIPAREIARTIEDFQPDLVHLASPLGGSGRPRRVGLGATGALALRPYARAVVVGCRAARAGRRTAGAPLGPRCEPRPVRLCPDR